MCINGSGNRWLSKREMKIVLCLHSEMKEWRQLRQQMGGAVFEVPAARDTVSISDVCPSAQHEPGTRYSVSKRSFYSVALQAASLLVMFLAVDPMPRFGLELVQPPIVRP